MPVAARQQHGWWMACRSSRCCTMTGSPRDRPQGPRLEDHRATSTGAQPSRIPPALTTWTAAGASPESPASRAPRARPHWEALSGRRSSRISGLGITGWLDRHFALELREGVGRDRRCEFGIFQAGERPAVDDLFRRGFIEAKLRQLLGRGRVEVDRVWRHGGHRRLLRGVACGVLRGVLRRALCRSLGNALSRRGGRRGQRETGQNQRRQPSTGSHVRPPGGKRDSF